MYPAHTIAVVSVVRWQHPIISNELEKWLKKEKWNKTKNKTRIYFGSTHYSEKKIFFFYYQWTLVPSRLFSWMQIVAVLCLNDKCLFSYKMIHQIHGNVLVDYILNNNKSRKVIWTVSSCHFERPAYIISLYPNAAIGWHISGSALVQIMVCCLTAPSHYLNQHWLVTKSVAWNASESNFIASAQDINP